MKNKSCALRNVRILHLEDEYLILFALAKGLQSQGAVVIGVPSVSEALEALETMPYDLILSKIKLQDGNGCSFIQKWQARARARWQSPIPAIAISNDLHEGKQALQAGFQMFLTKPVCSDEVIVAGTELLRLQNQIQRV